MLFRFMPCCFVLFRAGPCRIYHVVASGVVSRCVFCFVLRGRQRAGLCRLRAGADGSRADCAGAGWKAGRRTEIPCGEYGCCAAVRIVRACPDGADAARKGAGRCCRWCGFARDGGPVRRGNDSVQGVRRGRDCEYRLYSLSLPRSAAGKCMAAAFRKDFGP